MSYSRHRKGNLKTNISQLFYALLCNLHVIVSNTVVYNVMKNSKYLTWHETYPLSLETPIFFPRITVSRNWQWQTSGKQSFSGFPRLVPNQWTQMSCSSRLSPKVWTCLGGTSRGHVESRRQAEDTSQAPQGRRGRRCPRSPPTGTHSCPAVLCREVEMLLPTAG